MIMKFLSKISILLLSAAIFMSALVVFADNTGSQTLEWPYLKFTVSISEQNRIKDNDAASLSAKISDAVSAPFFALTRDYPDLTMWTTGFNVRSSYSVVTSGNKKTFTLMSLDYTFSGNPNYGDPSGMLGQLKNAVDDFTPSGSTMYDKLMSIHDFICTINTYVKESEGGLYCYSAYGSLVDKRSVCEGYAEAFKLLCDKAEIDCVLVTGMSLPDNDDTQEAHMWNLVRMDDNEWYAVDVTWDDAGDIAGNYNYFLVGTDTVVRGRKFNESHLASYDFIEIGGDAKTISALEYPTLSSIAYDKENGRTDYTYGGERFHYNYLDDLQKEIYDKMLSKLLSDMPSDPTKTPSYETTNGEITTPTETTTEPNGTTPEETTTVTDTTTSDTTTPADTTTPEDTTEDPTVTTTEPPTDTTTEKETDSVSTTPDNITEPPVSSSEKETDSSRTDTTVKTDTTAKDTESDTTKKPDETNGITTSDRDKESRYDEMQKLYKTVTTVVIVSAITVLSVILVIIVVRYTKKHGE